MSATSSMTRSALGLALLAGALGTATPAASQIAVFSADNKTILVANMVENEQQVLRLDGDRLTDSGQRVKVNGGPVVIRVADK